MASERVIDARTRRFSKLYFTYFQRRRQAKTDKTDRNVFIRRRKELTLSCEYRLDASEKQKKKIERKQ